MEYGGRCLIKSVLNFGKGLDSQNYFNTSAQLKSQTQERKAKERGQQDWRSGLPLQNGCHFWTTCRVLGHALGTLLGLVPDNSPLPFILIKLYKSRSCYSCSESHQYQAIFVGVLHQTNQADQRGKLARVHLVQPGAPPLLHFSLTLLPFPGLGPLKSHPPKLDESFSLSNAGDTVYIR